MATVIISQSLTDYIRDKLIDATDGIIRAEAYGVDGTGTAWFSVLETISFFAPITERYVITNAAVVFDVPAGTVIEGFRLHFWDGLSETLAVTYGFETLYSYTNQGTFTLESVGINIGG
jgi:hypothetical protein